MDNKMIKTNVKVMSLVRMQKVDRGIEMELGQPICVRGRIE